MKILFLNAYFYPENIAFSHIEQDIIEELINGGNEVTVICPTPTRGVSREEAAKWKKQKLQTVNGVHIHRFWAPREGNNPFIRAFRYFWCHFRENIIAKRYRETDVVFAVSTPPTQGYYAGKAAKKLGAAFVYSIQDVFPDSLVTTGMTTEKSLLYKIGMRIEKKTHAKCSKIIVLSETVKKNLIVKGVPESRLEKINNWIDTDAVNIIPKEKNRLFEEFGISRNRFTVVYAGNFGASQGADVILRAAELLKEQKEIQFVIFGSGSEFEKEKHCAEEHGLENVIINPLLPRENVPEVYSMGSVALICCKKGVGKAAMPSKLWSIMACETPIIASFDKDSELADILKETGAGVCVEPQNPEALAAAIKEQFETLGTRGGQAKSGARDYVIKYASKTRCARLYRECIERAAAEQKDKK